MKSLIFSFGYAFRGIYYALKYERNMRIHFVCMIYMYSFLLFTDFFVVSKTQLAVIFAMNALVLSLELINTSVERAVDLASDERSEKGRIAKDTAAGAVLIAAVFSVAAGIAVLWQPEAFSALWNLFSNNILKLALFIASIAAATVFIFKGFFKGSTEGDG